MLPLLSCVLSASLLRVPFPSCPQAPLPFHLVSLFPFAPAVSVCVCLCTGALFLSSAACLPFFLFVFFAGPRFCSQWQRRLVHGRVFAAGQLTFRICDCDCSQLAFRHAHPPLEPLFVSQAAFSAGTMNRIKVIYNITSSVCRLLLAACDKEERGALPFEHHCRHSFCATQGPPALQLYYTTTDASGSSRTRLLLLSASSSMETRPRWRINLATPSSSWGGGE